jgi:hypothetical protein
MMTLNDDSAHACLRCLLRRFNSINAPGKQ